MGSLKALATGCVVFLLSLSLMISNANALMVNVPLQDKAEQADIIAVGLVEGAEAKLVDAKNMLVHTFFKITPTKYLKGDAKQDKLIIEVPGGCIGEDCLWVSDQPEFKQGEKVLVFLTKKQNGVYKVTANFQGKFTVVDRTIVETGDSIDAFINQIREVINK